MAEAFRNQIAGLVRFSYPALDGFARADADPARRLEQLYAPSRLELRFRLFQSLTLPSLLAQSDGDFSLAVLIGDDFPQAAGQRLRAALAPLAQAKVVTLPPMQHFAAARRAYAAVSDTTVTHLTGFRLDDDDAIDRHFIARLRHRAKALAPLLGLSRPVVIGCNRGLVLTLDPNGNKLAEVTEKLPIGIGLAMTAPVGFRGSIFRRNHRLLPQFFSTFTDAEEPAFIRTVHAHNDSQPTSSGQSVLLDTAQASGILASHFPFSHAQLMAL
jgi:hypothetical protein